LKKSGGFNKFALALALLLWGFFVLTLPTLDFDEALYRRVAEGMKTTHNLWSLTWDGRDLFHKPPVFYWLIVLFSRFIDGESGFVSAQAARLPSFFSTIAILMYLYVSGNRIKKEKAPITGFLSATALLCGLFPVLTATGVIFDPLQTLLLMPALVVPTILFYDEKKLRTHDWFLWASSLFAASAVKGLNGLIVPCFAFALHLLFLTRYLGLQKIISWTIKFLLRVFLPATMVTLAYYFWLDAKIGRAFTHEFIWIQHFERGTSPMEQHSGSFFYQFLVVAFGGGVLTTLLLSRFEKIKSTFFALGFPITYCLSFCIIFGLSATKLPHYSWPVWPALALSLGLASADSGENLKLQTVTRLQRVWMLLARLPLLLVALFCFGLAFAPQVLLGLFSANKSFWGVVHYFNGFHVLEIASLTLAATLCLCFEWKRDDLIKSVPSCAVFTLSIAFFMTAGLTRVVQELLVNPFYEIANSVKKDGAQTNDCIRYSGTFSPTLSLALAPELIHNRCEPEDMRYLIAPEWKSSECEERHFKVIDQKAYLVLCKKG